MKDEFSTPFFSIISVVYNDKDSLESTIKNILKQSFTNFEYIIIDGGSTDGTLAIVEKYQSHIHKLVSEQDEGIYDAMNKGIGLASGKYVNFLNAGDSYYNDSTLQIVQESLAKNEPEILYGKAAHEARLDRKNGYSYVVGQEVKGMELYRSIPICHQAMFYLRELFEELGTYSLRLKIVADYEWTIRYYKKRGSLSAMSYFDEIIVKYPLTGFSFLNLKKVGKERMIVAKKHFQARYILLNYWIMIVLHIKSVIIPILEKTKILQFYRKMKYENE